MNDTDPCAEAILVEGYRNMSSTQKLERVRALTRAVQALALMDIRRRHPEWSREGMDRARSEIFQLDENSHTIRFSSPEDTVLHKLLWFKLGGSVSDRQWADILGVLRIQGEALDLAYLERWAALLNLADLLARARVTGAG